MAEMNPKEKSTLERVEKAHKTVATLEMKMEQYDEWSPHFDEDTAVFDYKAPSISVNMLYEVRDHLSFQLDNNSRIIDFAAGTGLVATCLRDKGFSGKIDAQDGSSGMLGFARNQGLYTNFYCCIIKPDTKLPVPENSYDVGFLVGALSDSQVHPQCMKILFGHMKVGGVIIFSTRMNVSNMKFKERLDSELNKLCEEGACRPIKLEEIKDFQIATLLSEVPEKYRSGMNSEKPVIPGIVYCYEKLK